MLISLTLLILNFCFFLLMPKDLRIVLLSCFFAISLLISTSLIVKNQQIKNDEIQQTSSLETTNTKKN